MSNLAIIGTQWGDEGKGKVVDLLAPRFDVVARYQGGHNAGHSVSLGGKVHAMHLIPSGVFHPGCVCLIGNGVVVDPKALLSEIELVRGWGVELSGRLMVAERAHVITAWHRELERQFEERLGESRIGTTGRGIGPAYAVKTARLGIRMVDLLRREVLREKIERTLSVLGGCLEAADLPSARALEDELVAAGETLRTYIADTSTWLWQLLHRGGAALFEGAQGTLLDQDHGTYPFVTSSNSTAGGIATGLGVGPREIHGVLGIIKAYSSRVGGGPFTTELKNATGDLLRERGREYGVSTGRPRRCGWLDLVAVRYAARVNGLDLAAVTLIDVLDAFDEIPVAVAYRYKGARLEDFPADLDVLEHAEPVYETVKGWKTSLRGCRVLGDLPAAARDYIKRIEDAIEAPVAIVSVGPDRSETIVREDLLARWPAREGKPSVRS